MTIYIRADRNPSTNLYRKLTDCSTVLRFQSNYSLKCIKSIVFSRSLRYNLHIATEILPQKGFDSLTVSLLVRKYPVKIITVTPFSIELPGYLFPEQSSQLCSHTLQKRDISPNQHETVFTLLEMTHNCTGFG